MRLSTDAINCIREAVFRFDPEAAIYLFGSRVDDSARGGDIDLLVVSQTITLMQVLDIKIAIKDGIGDQKIDLVVKQDGSEPFAQHAIATGVRL